MEHWLRRRASYRVASRRYGYVGYADDTLIVTGAPNWEEARTRINLAVACIVNSITRLGLRIAPGKSEAVYFYRKARGPPPPTSINVAGTMISVGPHLKYLGLYIDSYWNFHTHFEG